MSHKTSYTCDNCGKPVTELYGPMVVTARSFTEPQANADVDFCTYSCAAAWFANNGRPAKAAPPQSRAMIPRPLCWLRSSGG